MNSLIVLLTIIFITAIGYAFIKLFNLLSKDSLLAFSYSFGLGVALICFQMYLYTKLDIPWQKISLLTPWLVFILVVFIKKKIFIKFKFKQVPKTTFLQKFMILATLLTFAYVVFEALIRPATTWDSWATWLFQSKIFFINKNVDLQIFSLYKMNYPFLYNLFGTFTYIVLGKVNDTAVLLNSSAFYFFLILCFFAYTKKTFGFKKALLFTFLFATTQNLIRHGGRMEAGIADLPVGYYSFCLITLLLEYVKKNSAKILFIMTIFLGFLSVIKPEGTILSIFFSICVIYNILKTKKYKHLLVHLIWLIPIIDWFIFTRTGGLSIESTLKSYISLSLKTTKNALFGILSEVINIKSWNFLWIVYGYLLVFSFKNILRNKELRIINFIILPQIIIYLFIYIFLSSSYNPESSIERLLVHIAPLAMLSVTLSVDKTYKLKPIGNGKVMKFIYNFFSFFYRN
jgi:hypothetical protein